MGGHDGERYFAFRRLEGSTYNETIAEDLKS